MLDDTRLKSLLREHVDGEPARDGQWIKKTVAQDCEYEVIGPYYPDDPVKKAKKVSNPAVEFFPLQSRWIGHVLQPAD